MEIDLDGFVHGFNLKNKTKKDPKLKPIYEKYVTFRKNIQNLIVESEDQVKLLCKEFNLYRTESAYFLERRNNSAQENLRSSMMEEFFVHLFKDLIKNKLDKKIPGNFFIGKGNGYVDLTFSPKKFVDIFSAPGEYFHQKDQDFMFGAKFTVTITSDDQESKVLNKNDLIVPVVAIECKTYLERNMLDSCAGTASRIKKATPYCLYIVASEYLKLKDSHPELTDIDEVYVLCKEKNADRQKKYKNNEKITEIDCGLILDLFHLVDKHLNRIWWQPEKAVETGKIIHRI